MKLLIVESPAKAKTISKYLDGKYTVKASVGHIRDLPKSNKEAVDIEKGFIPHYEIVKGKEDIVRDIKKLSAEADEVLLATDPDREGEAIAWHISEAVKLKNPKRVTFHEITKEAIQEAIKSPRKIDENLKEAQEARRVLDRLFGYDLSGLIWKKVRYGLSAGRVQSPALRIIVEREREIRAFIPEKYWVINANLTNDSIKKQGHEYIEFKCSEEPKDEASTRNIVSKVEKGEWFIKDIELQDTKRSPRAPFTTSTLQQAGSSLLGFSPSRTMQLAQKLYEAGHITYMRTDSTTLSGQAIREMAGLITANYGAEYLNSRNYQTKSKNAQEAHEAIRPTHFNVSKVPHTDEDKLYKMIWRRAVASQMADAKIKRTRVIANIKSADIPDFIANGSTVIFDGWMKADQETASEENILPEMQKDDALILVSHANEEKETLPPPRYTEAGLVKELEKRGIGRPSTYASIIRTIEERGYVEKEGKSLHSTDTGEVVCSFLEEYFAHYISDVFTAEMEDKLDAIANGERTYIKTLSEFYGPFHKEVKSKDKIDKITTLGDADPKYTCPKCGSKLVIKLGKTGKFMSCSKYPDCDGALTMEGKELAGPRATGEMCPDCGSPLVERDGRFGLFIACSKYPKCKFVKNDPKNNASNTGVKCPECKEGDLIGRKGRFGIFYSCSNYPKCKFAIKAKPTGNICKMCGSLMMEGTKTIPERCSSKICPNHNPQKLTEKTIISPSK